MSDILQDLEAGGGCPIEGWGLGACPAPTQEAAFVSYNNSLQGLGAGGGCPIEGWVWGLLDMPPLRRLLLSVIPPSGGLLLSAGPHSGRQHMSATIIPPYRGVEEAAFASWLLLPWGLDWTCSHLLGECFSVTTKVPM